MAQISAVPTDQLSLFDLGVDVTKLREGRLSLLSWKRSHGTHKGYSRDFRIFSAWCENAGRVALPTTADTLSLFLYSELQSGLKVSTVERRLAGICYTHKSQRHPDPATPECRELLLAARRQRKEQPKGKRSLEVADLIKISRRLGKSNLGVRDRAVIIFGFASGLRRSEIARLDLADVGISRKGLVVNLSWSKTDQKAEGRTFGIFAGERQATDPVSTMRAWLAIRGKEPGPLFTRIQYGCDDVTLGRLGPQAIRDIVHRAVRRIGLDVSLYAAHSLRAGLVTAAADNGASDREIMRASGHKSVRVMERYVRHTRVFAERNPLAGVL